MKLVLLSDTHALENEIDVPAGDVLIHAGDFTMFSKDESDLRRFNTWLGTLPHTHKIVVPGNHEFSLEADLKRRALLTNATVLLNSSTTVNGLIIWGSPVTPLYGGAFGMSSELDRRALYASIPNDIDVIVTHGPPYGILDASGASGDHVGCHELLNAVLRVRPKLHVFGHVHGAAGIFSTPHTTFVNAAMLGLEGALATKPTVLLMKKHNVGRRTKAPGSGEKK